MLFNSFEYLLFLPLVVLLYWIAPPKLRVPILIAASYWFYMSWMRVYGLLLFALTLVNYLLGLVLSRTRSQPSRRLVLIAGITANLGTLCLFKYTNFLIDLLKQAGNALQLMGTPAFVLNALNPFSFDFSPLPIILPLGISFFVFEFIHYLTDVFKGSKPIVSPLRFALFASFFPSQIAGPIKRFQDFEHQLSLKRTFRSPLFGQGVFLIAQGLFKKVVLGDNLAPLANAGFKHPELLGTGDAWMCTAAFALQIYYDFSGYTDIGRGSAMLLGFELPENFNMPYIARSLREFWHRWHISLSTWLRDYLFIPLGGSRGKESSTLANLLITMLLGGLWHGAAWHFVVWGAFHGTGLAINRVFDDACKRSAQLSAAVASPAGQIGCYALTLLAVLAGWVLFRADTIGDAATIYSAMFSLRESAPGETIATMFWQTTLPIALTLYALYHAISRLATPLKNPEQLSWHWMPLIASVETIKRASRLVAPPRLAVRAVAAAAFCLATAALAPHVSIPFLYFQF